MRQLRGCTWLCLVVLCGEAVIAQPPSPRNLTGAATDANPAHERLKIEAEQAYQASDFAKAIESTGRVLAENPRDHVALYLRASARVELGQVQGNLKEVRAGVEDAREAMRHGGTDQVNYYLPYFYGMTALSQMEQRPEHAQVVVDFSQQVLQRPQLKPEEVANLRYQRASAEVFLQKFDDAAKDFSIAVEQVPGHIGARLGLADTYVRLKQFDRAEAAFTAAAQAVPNNPLIYNNRGMFFQNQGKTQQAIADFTRAIELDKSYSVAFINRGFAAMSEGRGQVAEADFTAALQIDPNQPLVYSLRGTARLSRGDAQSAIVDYQEALRLNPRNPIAQADLGFAKYFAGDYAGALAALDAAVAAEPNLRYLNPWRYWSAIKGGQTPQAAAAKLGDSLTKDAAARDWIDNLGVYLSGGMNEATLLGLVEKTDTNLRAAQSTEAYYFQAEKQAQAGAADAAKGLYQQALQLQQAHLSAYRGSQYALKSFVSPAK